MSDDEHHSFDPFQLTGDRSTDDAELLKSLQAYCEPSNGSLRILYCSLSNVAALLGWYLKDVNWVGFYLTEGDELILSPFHGLPACTRIKIGKGVCGASFKDKKQYNVKDVHEFPGHIACDSASNSELVTPIIKNGEVVGVLDIDSPKFSRFDEKDDELCQKIAQIIADTCF
ncbi:Free methionine-R-sulfoxide reductase [Tritrichomonas foetus]|uniref:Free methionine-R-sulfoxide reductase n=1 Tax=Tritrichomonas foetus TaxID=1144522 RepID=A0A1J4K2D1_9EUKA|nr:Free methionine-R-sulfoxide reductase [Tritrichomonas foetus]|eukprot:OHT05551.1 Free methionine-R-sulfoxide reductase [Tritrichomonas foetus]